MRVAIFAPMNFDRALGDVIRVLEIASNLERKGCEITLIVPHGSSEVIKAEVSRTTEYMMLNSKNSYVNYLLSSLSSSFFAQGALKTKDFDVVQTELSYLIPGTPLSRLLKTLPLVCDLHSIDAFDLADVFSWPLRPIVCSLAWSWQRSLVRVSRGILAVSHKMKEYLVKSTGVSEEQIAVIHNGVNIRFSTASSRETSDRYSWVREMGDFIIAYVGSLERYEGVDILIKAFHRLQRRHISAFLVIAGSGTRQGELKALAKNLDLHDKIRFLGNIPYKETFGLQANADVLVAPRSPMKVYDISFPVKVVNYLSSQKPVVCSAVGDIPLVFENFRDLIIVKAEDPIGLADTLELILGDTNLRKRLSLNAGRKAAEFDWGTLTRKLVNFYEKEILS